VKPFLAKVTRGERLSEQEAGLAMTAIMDGEATPAQIGALLAALAVRGETEDEIVGFARTMRARAVPVVAPGAIDTCGTGGDGAGTFNISTVASLVVAACGVPVAKHGNRSASGGSADLLEALGLGPGEEVSIAVENEAIVMKRVIPESVFAKWRGVGRLPFGSDTLDYLRIVRGR